MLLNGKSFELILKDAYLKSHFIFICSLLERVICYNMTPIHKKLMVILVQQSFPKKPSVLAIGDGFNDVLMMKNAAVSVEKLTKISKNTYIPILNCGDIQVSHLTQLKNLMVKKGITFNLKNERLVFLIFYHFSVIGYSITLFNIFTDLSANPFTDSLTLFFIGNCFFVINYFFFGIMNVNYLDEKFSKYPNLSFYESQKTAKYSIKKFLINSQIEAILHSTIIVFVSNYSIINSFSSDGKTYGYNSLSFLITVSIISTINFKV